MNLDTFWQNPILLRTQRQSARVQRTPWIVLAAIVTLTLLVAAIGGIAAESGDPAAVGTGIFGVFFGVAAFFVTVFGAVLAGQGLASEHQGRTWEMLLLTGMTPRRIVAGKYFSALANVLLYLAALSPISAVAFVFGGVSAMQMFFGFVFLVGLAALAVAFGLAIASSYPAQGTVLACLAVGAMFLGVGPFLGFGGAALVQSIWPVVGGDSPVWWPAAVTRAPLDLRYALFVWAIPVSAFALPTWLGIELAVAQVSESGQDRFYAFKRALLLSVAVACALSCASVFLATTSDQVFAGLIFAYVLHVLLALALTALAADDLYPFRRARHALAGTSAGRRLLGPSLVRGCMLFLVAWMLSVLLFSSAGVIQLVRFGTASYQIARILVAAMGTIPFVLFATGFLVFVRAGRQTPLVSLIVLAAMVVALTGGPWVLYAIAGGISRPQPESALIVLGSPSPAFVFTLLTTLGSSASANAQVILGSGVIMAFVYVLAGLGLFAAAARRVGKAEREELAYHADVERRLAEEDQSDHRAAPAEEP